MADLIGTPITLQTDEHLTIVKRRSEYSGKGKHWSVWFSLASDKPPDGYHLHAVDFHLEGDRHCGSWAECREISRTADSSTWEFRMQGHEEGPVDSISTGVLTTTFLKVGSDVPTYQVVIKSPRRFSGQGNRFGCFERPPFGTHSTTACQIEAPPPKPGYIIKFASFELSGDRNAKGDDLHPRIDEGYARCMLTARTETSATWSFSMQGHEEWSGIERYGVSQASLIITYARKEA